MKSQESIRRNMQHVRCKDSKIELTLRKELWRRGLRYRKNVGSVFGKPDIVFLSKKVAVFCDSEFWHGYRWQEHQNDFRTNRSFWIPKIERNIRRDQEVTSHLQKEGWIVLRFWGKQILKEPEACADRIEGALKHDISSH